MLMKLKCTQEQFEGIHADLDKTRRTSEFTKVNREALTNLLMDHANLIDVVNRREASGNE